MAKTARFLIKGGLVVVAFTAIALGVAWVFRTDIAEYAALRWLASRGLPDAALKVERLDLHGLDAAGLVLGPNGDLAVEQLSVRYDPWALLEGRVETVALEGLSLRLDLRPGEQPLGPLQPLLAGEGQSTPAKQQLVLPDVSIERGRISALTPLGDVGGTFQLRFHASQHGVVAGKGDFALSGPAETASGMVDLAPDGELALKLDMELAAASGLWALMPEALPMRGEVRVTAQGEGQVGPLNLSQAGQLDAAELLENIALQGNARLSVEQLDVPKHVRNVEARADLRYALKDGILDVGLNNDASAVIAALAPEIENKLPEEVRPLLKGPIEIGVGANGDAPLLLSVRRSNVLLLGGSLEAKSASGAVLGLGAGKSELFPGLSGSGTVAVTVPRFDTKDLNAANFTVLAPLYISREKGGFTVNLETPGEIRIGRYGVGKSLRSTAPLVLTIEQEQAFFSTSGEFRLTGRLKGKAAGLQVGEAGLAVEATPGLWEFSVNGAKGKTQIAASVSGAGARLPARNFLVENISAKTSLNERGRLDGRITGAELKHLGKPAYVAPLTLSGGFGGEKGAYRFDGEVADKTGALSMAIKARHGADGRGGADLSIKPIEFSDGGLQPGQLSPLLRQISRASGGLSGQAKLGWGTGKLTSEGQLILENLSFVSDQAKVTDLDGTITFDSLLPPSTPAGQRLTVKSVDPAVPLQDVALLFSVEPGEPPRLQVAEGSFLLAGGRVVINDAVFIPGARRHDVSLVVSSLDLERLLDMVKVEGLDGTGLLNGRIPIRIADGGVAISKGLLEAEGGGVIRFRSEAAARALSGGGEAVTLMLDALENFQYDDLKVNVRKDERGDAQIGLHLLGRNPDVLEGHPFRFNINLEGNLDRILAALKQGNRISGDLIRRSTGQ